MAVVRASGSPERPVHPTPGDLDEREQARVAPYVTDTSGPVFALTGLPEVVKGALFARYSRSPKSLRRLLLDEFLPPDDGPGGAGTGEGVGSARAEALYDRVLAEYGDDSVAQLGGAHIAVEGASNVLTKVLQWGRLASYLEQSTRYIPYTDRPGGAYRYHRPPSVLGHPELGPAYTAALDAAFDGYSALLPRMVEHVGAGVPLDDATPEAARERAIRARALDLLRGLLPAATTANVGIFASGQAYEAMLVRMQAHPLPEARDCAAAMLRELRTVIPAFLTRVNRVDRGVAGGAYLTEVDRAAARLAERLAPSPARRPTARGAAGGLRPRRRGPRPGPRPVAGERRAPRRRAQRGGRAAAARARGGAARVGRRPGRPAPAARPRARGHDLRLRGGVRLRRLPRPAAPSPAEPPGAAAHARAWGMTCPTRSPRPARPTPMPRSRRAAPTCTTRCARRSPREAAYAVTLAHRIRFTMVLNAREAMHLIELRSQPQGHESYRAVAQEMHRQIAEVAGHRAIAAMMAFVDHSGPGAGRLAAERRQEARRAGR